MAVLGWGSSGPEVQRLQERLKALGAYYGLVDGAYGPLTHAAVRRFQDSVGLPVDGIAGPDTLAALEAAGPVTTGSGTTGVPGGSPPEGGAATGRALSLHIGMNRVDPAGYGGWDGRLSGCENDAQTMGAIAAAEGFTARHLVAPQATAATIFREVRRAAQALTAGGTFLLTYAGHGGQRPDPTGEEEVDHQDETWVAYDRQILDDELEQAFAEFVPGVRVVVFSDSCHSGTVHRLLPPPADGDGSRGAADAAQGQDLQRRFAALKASFYEGLAVTRPGPGDPPFSGFPRPQGLRSAPGEQVLVRAAVPAGAAAGGSDGERSWRRYGPAPVLGDRSEQGAARAYATRSMPFDANERANRSQDSALTRAKAASRDRGPVRAQGILLAGCQDNQLSQEVGGAGVFTSTVSRVWASGGFTGTYTDLVDQVVAQMGPTQTPQLALFGVDAGSLAARTPFDVA